MAFGAATATLLAARGASVVVNYLKNAATASQVVAQIHANGGQALAVQANIRDQQQAEALVQAARDTYGRIDILVNSSSPSGVFKPFEQMNWEEVATVVDVGGGTGALLAEILRSRPEIHGTLVDLPRTVARAGSIFQAASVVKRVRTVGQSFFDPLPDHSSPGLVMPRYFLDDISELLHKTWHGVYLIGYRGCLC